MKKVLLSGALLAVFSVSSAMSSMLTIEVFDGASLVGFNSSITGNVSVTTFDSNFSSINVAAAGATLIPFADLSSVSLNVKSRTTGARTLSVDVFQTGVSAPAGTHLQSTFTTNDLIGDPGPTVESTFWNGTNSTLGTLLATHTFPVGVTVDHFGPVVTPISSALFADAHQYVVTFTGAGQSSNDTIQLTTGIPETKSWAMLAIGLGFMGLLGWRRNSRPNSAPTPLAL